MLFLSERKKTQNVMLNYVYTSGQSGLRDEIFYTGKSVKHRRNLTQTHGVKRSQHCLSVEPSHICLDKKPSLQSVKLNHLIRSRHSGKYRISFPEGDSGNEVFCNIQKYCFCVYEINGDDNEKNIH